MKDRMVTVPVVRWTSYGRWTQDGLHVVNNRGGVIYSRPEVPLPLPVYFPDHMDRV
jgi:hypothetical protein